MLQQPAIDVNLADLSGNTPLHACADADNVEGLRLLLAHPAMTSLNARNGDGMTPLMFAIGQEAVGCVRELVQVDGVDLDTRDNTGLTLEEVAVEIGAKEVQEVLKVARRRREREEEVAALRRSHEERLQELLQQNEERVERQMRENEERLERMARENEERVAGLIQANEAAEAEVRARHQLEELRTPRPTSSSAPECPVGILELEFDPPCCVLQVCLEEMRPPANIFQCENGHLVCGGCRWVPA